MAELLEIVDIYNHGDMGACPLWHLVTIPLLIYIYIYVYIYIYSSLVINGLNRHFRFLDMVLDLHILCFRKFGNFTRRKLLLHIDGTKRYFPSAVESCQSDRWAVGSSNITQSDHLWDYRTFGT